MAKKAKVQIHHDDDLAALDQALNQALDRLENTNLRVNELLKALTPPPEPSEPSEPRKDRAYPNNSSLPS